MKRICTPLVISLLILTIMFIIDLTQPGSGSIIVLVIGAFIGDFFLMLLIDRLLILFFKLKHVWFIEILIIALLILFMKTNNLYWSDMLFLIY